MRCSMCPFLADCVDPAQFGGGCDCDGADDFDVDPLDDIDDKLTHAADHLAAKMEEAAADVVANTAWVQPK